MEKKRVIYRYIGRYIVMPFPWTARSSSSSSDRPLNGKSKSSNDIYKNNVGASSDEQKRRLTRQRKLRHVTDDELGFKSTAVHDGSQSLPVSPKSGLVPSSGTRTPRGGGGCVGHWSKSAVPQPLPLPEMNSHPKQNDSPHPGPAILRNPSHQTSWKTTDDFVTKTYASTTYQCRGRPLELNLDTSENDFHRHFPARSAPGSGYSSPILSPQRHSTVDLFHPSSFQVSSVDEYSNSDRISKSYQISPIHTPEHSPLHSPTFRSQSDHGNFRICNRAFMHAHHKSFPDSNNANVHPLPLPPTVSRPSPSSRHSIDKLDVPSIKGQWQRGKPIGRGTYGSVYIATHRETGAMCAVKEVEIISDDPKSAECIKQLEQEIKFLRELKHPNIVQYYGCETIEDRFCIYLEYVHPGSINKYVHEHCGAMTESIVRNFTRHILSGLAYLHNKKTIHRDIKGANLLVNASGVVKLADFGLAKHLTGYDINLSLKGTPHWMAPEVLQAALRKDANPELAYGVDIWSVGCTVIEMLTGKPPWSEYSEPQAMFNVLRKAPPIPETLSTEGKDFLARCFQRRPVDRPSAIKLLEHPFLRSSQEPNFAGFVPECSGIKLTDDWTRRNKDLVPLSSATRSHHGKLSLNAETSRQSCPESSDMGTTSRHSPRSTLEVNPRSSNSSSPSNAQNNVFQRGMNDDIYSFSCKGNLTLLMPKLSEIKKQGSSNVQQKIN
ncbi:hypothetical protein BUALT_Bualt08G0055300 [Buddleja alternifolia]|uniref:mitogen-activated protein kinase kinase kinase n=1 Tax=Buddleja alternifolia TaxID=168488 RepID=A0AAV6X5E1_9LAMI|nr:hypothetical protein BUALT_Bualt08G0055300 [Buddleja alternifolia]